MRDVLLVLAQDAWRPRWQVDFDGTIRDESLVDLLWLESRVVSVRCYGTVHVPDLLRTAEYARAEFRHHGDGLADGGEERADNWARLCLDRQQVLSGDPPARLEVLLDECVLHRPVDDPGVWRGQLEHLCSIAGRPGVDLRMVPARAGVPPGVDGGFAVFSMPEPLPEVVHVQYLGGRLFLEDVHVERHVAVFDRLRRAALGPRESAALIAAYTRKAT